MSKPAPQSPSASTPVEIEPFTKEEQKERGKSIPPVDDPEFPDDWKPRAKEIATMIDQSYKYRRRNQNGKTYMTLRKGNSDKGIGLWSEEREAKLFTFFPNVISPNIQRPPPWTSQGTVQSRSFLSVPINRVAIIPRDYVPSISVIRYFQILKENGFPGDFSQFVNDIVTQHFKVCNGIQLPVLVEEDVELRREEDV